MTRSIITRSAIFFFALVVNGLEASAGLLGALSTALNQAGFSEPVVASTIVIPLDAERVSQVSPVPVFSGTLDQIFAQNLDYIDPIESTFGLPVFRGGPEIIYDPSSGGLTVTAPPALGPADEFGLRNQYSAVSITVEATGGVANPLASAKTKAYVRRTADSFIASGDLDEQAERLRTTPSFASDSNRTAGFGHLGSLSDVIELKTGTRVLSVGSDLIGLTTRFDALLEEGLPPSDIGIPLLADFASIGLMFDSNYLQTLLPSVYATVQYQLVNNAGGSLIAPRSITVLARPRIVPEPMGSTQLLIAGALLFTTRRFAPRVA